MITCVEKSSFEGRNHLFFNHKSLHNFIDDIGQTVPTQSTHLKI